MSERSTDSRSVTEVPQSLEQRLAALEGRNIEIRKQNADLPQENKALAQRVRTLEIRLATTEDTLINLSPDHLGKQTHKAFALFPKLPPELRRMTWTLARPPPRVINIFRTKVGGKDVLYSTAKVPSLLQVCQESRRVAKGWYQLSFSWFRNWNDPYAARVYFDFSADFLYLSFPTYLDDSSPSRLFPESWGIDNRSTEKVKKVVQEVSRWWEEFSCISVAYPFATEALLGGRRRNVPGGG